MFYFEYMYVQTDAHTIRLWFLIFCVSQTLHYVVESENLIEHFLGIIKQRHMICRTCRYFQLYVECFETFLILCPGQRVFISTN